MDYLHVQADNHGITIYTTYISVDLAHYQISRANAGKGDTNDKDAYPTNMKTASMDIKCYVYSIGTMPYYMRFSAFLG